MPCANFNLYICAKVFDCCNGRGKYSDFVFTGAAADFDVAKMIGKNVHI